MPKYIQHLAFTIFFCAIPEMLFAGRIDYSGLSDDEMKITVIFTIVLLSIFAITGIIAWVRYLRSYQPRPGTFTPIQVLVIVLSLIISVIVFALFQLQLL